MKRYKSILKEGMRYNTSYFEAGKDLRSAKKIDTVIGVLEEMIMELKAWKKEGAKEVQGNKNEFIPLW
jgi:hypothetical protein